MFVFGTVRITAAGYGLIASNIVDLAAAGVSKHFGGAFLASAVISSCSQRHGVETLAENLKSIKNQVIV